VSDSSDDAAKKVPMTAPVSKSRRRGRDAAPDAAFDAWLNQGLNAMFGQVANEPIPPELLALIEQSRKDS
jgi:hypothetical protein